MRVAILNKLKTLTKSIWFFPSLVISGLLIISALGISGSSINVFDKLLGNMSADKNLVIGEPRVVRSDEWYVNTPFVLSQVANDYPVYNEDIGDGQDMTVVIDVPYKDWSILFRPQNLVFFILPTEQAFAFKWWLLGAILMLSTYFFVLSIYPKKKFLAALLGIFMVWNPFIQWWYQSITILPIAYTLLALGLARMLNRPSNSLKRNILLTAALAYTVAAFALVMYPPFQIACALVGLAVFLALNLSDKKARNNLLRWTTIKWYAIATAAALIIVGTFLFAHQNVIQTITHTSYPGERSVPAGGMSIADVATWPIAYTYLRGGPPTALGSNQSEVSRFPLFGILLLPYLIYAVVVLIKKDSWRKHNTSAAILIGSIAAIGFFLFRAFVPIADPLYKLLQIDSTPHIRLLVGVGIINMLLLLLALTLPSKAYSGIRSLFSLHSATVFIYCFLLVFIGLQIVNNTYHPPGLGTKEVLLVSMICAGVIALIAHPIVQLRYVGLVLAVVYAFLTSAPVNPLYRGLGSTTDSELVNAIRTIEKQDNLRWIATDKMSIDPLLITAGAETFSTVETYPQNNIWEKYFPEQRDIYNRYAHVKFDVDDILYPQPTITLNQLDSFTIGISSCDPMLKDLKIGYIVANANSPNKYACFNLIKNTKANATNIGIFKNNL